MKKINIKSIINNAKICICNNKEKIVIICVAVISLFALYYPGFIYTHDGIIHLYRTAGMYENIKNMDIFNKIYYNCVNGLGYGWGIFYPPLSALIPAMFMCLGFSLLTAEKLFIIVSTIFAGLFGYKLFKELYGNNFCAMLSAVVYILAPYKMNQAIIRGAMGEILIFTFVPLVFLGLIKIIKGESRYKYYFIFGMIGIVYSHVISIVYTTIFGGLFVALNFKRIFKKSVIKDFAISCIVIIIVSLPLIVPILRHQSSDKYIISGIETDVADRVVHPGQLISSSIEGKEAENTPYYSDDKEMNYMIGPSFIVILLLVPFLYKKIRNNNPDSHIWIYVVLLAISIIMMIFKGIWNKFEVLDVIQYPWRILLYSVLFISIICGYILKELMSKENKYIVFLIVVSYSFLFAFMIGNKVRFAKNLNNDFNFYNQELNQNDDYGSISFSLGYAHEYLPKTMSTDVIKNKQKRVDVLCGKCDIYESRLEKNVFYIDMNNNTDDTVIELPLIYYEGYEINIENAESGELKKNISYEMSKDGFISVSITDTGRYKVMAKYTGTKFERILNFFAIIVICIETVVVIIHKKKENKVK